MDYTSPNTSLNKLKTWEQDEHPGADPLNQNWQAIATKLDVIDETINDLDFASYATKAQLAGEALDRQSSDTEVLSAAKTYADSKVIGKADFYSVDTAGLGTEDYQIVDACEMVYDGREETFIDVHDLATKAYVTQQSPAVGITLDMFGQLGVGGSNPYSMPSWFRFENGVLKYWASGNLSYAALCADPTKWQTILPVSSPPIQQ